ncbi:MAG: hypothetical protein HYS27_28210, partial [Deltaproteobacteria bacterium]|nr:hypothetical protein [Deltaproteobacteria bacterium]
MRALARDAFAELRPRLPVREAAGLPPRLALRLGVAAPVAVGGLLALSRDAAGAQFTGALAAATVVGFAAGAFLVPHALARLAHRRLPAPAAAGPLGVIAG